MLYRIFDTEVAFQVVTITYIIRERLRRELSLCFHRHDTMLVSILVFFSLLFVKTFCSVVDFPTRFLNQHFWKTFLSFEIVEPTEKKQTQIQKVFILSFFCQLLCIISIIPSVQFFLYFDFGYEISKSTSLSIKRSLLFNLQLIDRNYFAGLRHS